MARGEQSMNKFVAAITANKVVHLVVWDERRYNFLLNKSNANIALPGVHLDSGRWLPSRNLQPGFVNMARQLLCLMAIVLLRRSSWPLPPIHYFKP